MKKNIRNILLLVGIIVVVVVFLKHNYEGFFASIGIYPARYLNSTHCATGYDTYVMSDLQNVYLNLGYSCASKGQSVPITPPKCVGTFKAQKVISMKFEGSRRNVYMCTP